MFGSSLLQLGSCLVTLLLYRCQLRSERFNFTGKKSGYLLRSVLESVQC